MWTADRAREHQLSFFFFNLFSLSLCLAFVWGNKATVLGITPTIVCDFDIMYISSY